jgi:hypothetical protein
VNRKAKQRERENKERREKTKTEYVKSEDKFMVLCGLMAGFVMMQKLIFEFHDGRTFLCKRREDSVPCFWYSLVGLLIG